MLTPLSLWAQKPSRQEPDFSALRRQVQVNMEKGDVPGLSIGVAKGGRILWQEGFGLADVEKRIRATQNTPFYIASITKTITATAVMQLQERGKLRLDNSVNDYLGQEKVHSPMWNASEATVRRMLSHTSGLTTFARWCFPSESSACNLGEEIERYGILVWPPGEVFDYSNLGYGILGDVIARTSGRSFDSYLRNAIFEPLEMNHCGLELGDSLAKIAAAQYHEKTHKRSARKTTGHPGASGLHCSVHDLLLFGMFHLKDPLKAHPLLTVNIDEMHRAQPNTHGQYGLGWWIKEQAGYQVISAQGGTSDSYALLTLIPSRDIAIVVISNSYSKFVSELGDRILSALLAGFASGMESPPNEVPSQHKEPTDLTGKWAGQILTYRGPVDASLDIGADGSVRGQIGIELFAPVANVSLKPRHFYGQLPGDPAIADAPTYPYLMELDLALQGDDLMGAATSRPLNGEDGDELPHWIKLSRTR